MKRWTCAVLAGLISSSILLSESSIFAQVKKDIPTFPGDTESTISRRAKWIEEAKKEGALDWWGILTPQEGYKVIAEFNKVYPFIKATYWRGSPVEIAAKLEAGHAAGLAFVDIMQGGSSHNYPRWRKMGFFEKITDIIPGIERIPKNMYSKEGDCAQPGNNATAPLFNTKLVSETEAPKSWEDLLDPRWKGQIAVTPRVTSWYTLALGDGGWGVEKTEKFLTRLRDQKLIYASSNTAGVTLMTTGEFKILADGFVYHALQVQEKGMPGNWGRVNPIPVTGPSFTLQKRASHPDAARLFLEWLFSPPGLVAYESITYYGAIYPGSGTRLTKVLEGLTLINRTEEVDLKAIELGLEKKFSQILGITP